MKATIPKQHKDFLCAVCASPLDNWRRVVCPPPKECGKIRRRAQYRTAYYAMVKRDEHMALQKVANREGKSTAALVLQMLRREGLFD